MAVIAISGYSGSGKDLVGRMIQTLMCPNVFGMSDGHILQIIKDYDTQQWWIEETSKWEIKKFAGKLKEVASMLTGIPLQRFEDQDFKRTHLDPQWDQLHIRQLDKRDGSHLLFGPYQTEREAHDRIDTLKRSLSRKGLVQEVDFDLVKVAMTVRDFLQKLGTDGLRDGLHPNVWVNALFADYECTHTDHVPGGLDCTNWIITDCRFPNEAQAVKKYRGIILRVNRPGVTAVNAHPSETALDDWGYDDVIDNSGSLEDLLAEVKRVLQEQSILV